MSTAANLDPSLSRGSEPENPAQDELDNMNILWTIFALTCASSIHNLGSAPGFPASLRRYYFRVLPLCSLFDMLVMYVDFWTRWRQQCGRRHGTSIRQILKSARVSAREVAVLRLFQTQTRAGDDQVRRHGEGKSGGMSANPGDSDENSFLFDSWSRLFADAGLIFVYTKINGFRFTNAPLLQAIATGCFVSWFSMEISLYLAFGFMFGTRGGSLATDVELRRASEKTRPLWSQSNDARKRLLRAIGLLLVVGPIMALLSLLLPAAVDWSREALYGEGSALVSPPAGEGSSESGKGGQALVGTLDYVQMWYTQVVPFPASTWPSLLSQKGVDLGDYTVQLTAGDTVVYVFMANLVVWWNIFAYTLFWPFSVFVSLVLALLPLFLIQFSFLCAETAFRYILFLARIVDRWAQRAGVRRRVLVM